MAVVTRFLHGVFGPVRRGVNGLLKTICTCRWVAPVIFASFSYVRIGTFFFNT